MAEPRITTSGNSSLPVYERALHAALDHATAEGCPPRLAKAMHYAVFPGGARVRPQLCLAVAAATGDYDAGLAGAAGAAIELLHCASLVHDDLPCFDNAHERRGKASVHHKFGEQLALLCGDALIVEAFSSLTRAAVATEQAHRLPALMACIAGGVGAPMGICAGQAWECEPEVDLARYHQAKTGALFIAATCAGATVAGADPALWRPLGDAIGHSYQVADDILDAAADASVIGKPTGQDVALDRPSAVRQFGLEGAVQHLRELVDASVDAVPACPGREQLQALVRNQSRRFLPKGLVVQAA
ncbi:polyprenyl synthetase family protein [Chromatocurvus halotolerans]|uniref:Farnesyl-diphosphate synthase n=1 Tax=Chromatocurvus halotolerans TaxID=1132028 RepID=A0A4R2KWF3_9GAMM|nr:polyprenyl synthetase family protein [Chromatocurvus halotolerans]TCO77177.1 farnesyl-diphosphate synthase [Chromatocurvus halotolerans]